jgi:hypothetical protein
MGTMQRSVVSRLGHTYYAVLICAALLLVAAALIRLIPPDPGYIRATFTIEHVELLNLFDNRGQQWAHRVLVGLIGILALGLWAVRPKAIRNPPPLVEATLDFLTRHGGIAFAILYVLVVSLDGRPLVGDQAIFHGRYALFPSISVRTQLLLAVLGIACVYGWAHLMSHTRLARAVSILALAASVTYMLALIFFGVLRQPSFMGFTPNLMAGVEWHYSGAVASADRIGIGERVGEVPIHSSLLASVLLGIWENANGVLDFGDHIRLLAILQVVMIVVMTLAYAAWYRWRAGPWLIGLLLVLPWMQPMQAAVLYPNQSSWRFFGLCVGIATLAFAHTAKLRSIALLLGFVGGLALLWNPETGVVLNLAYCVFLILQSSKSPASGLKNAAAYVAGAGCALLGFFLIVRVGLGYWPDAVAVLKSFPLIGNFSLGYGGLAFTTVDLLALLVFAHALFLVIRGIFDWASSEALSPRECARIALAALLVAWAGYYFKAPHPWNLWSSLLIYGFLIGDLVPGLRPGGNDTRLWRLVASPGPMILAIVIIPAIVVSNIVSLSSVAKAAREPHCTDANLVSGICLPRDLADLVRKKADTLRSRAAEQRILYFTADVYLMPLITEVSQPLRQRDAFSDAVRPSGFDQLVSDVLTVNPPCLLFDDPRSPLSGYDSHRKFYARLRATLPPEYERRVAENGWEVYCRTSNS